MKSLFKFSFSILILSGLLLGCSQVNAKDKDPKNGKSNQEEKEQTSKVEKRPSLFPLIVAGSISIIQKVYIRKEE